MDARHARWYVELAERLRAMRSETRLRRLDLEPDNFRAALAWLLANDAAGALQLADSLGDWWLMRGRLVEGREWLEAALEQSQPTPITAAVLLRAMAFVGRSGGMSEGERLAERSLVISRELGDGEGMSQALQVLGVWAWIRGPYPRARELLDEAIEAARLARSPLAEANAQHALGLVAAATRDLAGAREVLDATVELLDGAARGGRIDIPRRDAWTRAGDRAGRTDPAGRAGGLADHVPTGGPRAARRLRAQQPRDRRAPVRRRGTRPTCCSARRSRGCPLQATRPASPRRYAAIGRLATLQGDAERAQWALGEGLEPAPPPRRHPQRRPDARAARGAGRAERRPRTRPHTARRRDRDVRRRPRSPGRTVAPRRARPRRAARRLAGRRARASRHGAQHLRGTGHACHARVDPGIARRDPSARRRRRARRRLLEAARDDLSSCGDAWGVARCDALALDYRRAETSF